MADLFPLVRRVPLIRYMHTSKTVMQLGNLSLALHCNGFVYHGNLFSWIRYHNYDLIFIPYASITAIFPREPGNISIKSSHLARPVASCTCDTEIMSSLCARMLRGPVILRSISYWCMKDPERVGFQLQLGHCQGTCSKGTADTEYMSIKAVGPTHHYSLASHIESAM